jgi:glutathione S-transferase
MMWIDLVTLLAVIQFFCFAFFVGSARVKYGVRAPATTGNLEFERYFRVQQNTLETLIMFVPALWIAARYWPIQWMALIGAVYLVGRVIYFFSYVRDPNSRTLGYALSIGPVGALVVFGLVGIAMDIIKA